MYANPAKISCFQVKHVVICLTIFSISLTACCSVTAGSSKKQSFAASYLVLEFLTLYGACKLQPRALRVALWASAFFSGLWFVALLISPLVITASYASGYEINSRSRYSPEVARMIDQANAATPPIENFNKGLMMGAITETVLALGFTFHLAKYILIKRLYVYVTLYPITEEKKDAKEFA